MTARSCRSARRPNCSSGRSHTFVGYFIGSPGMNVLPVEARRRNGAARRARSIELPGAPDVRRRHDRARHPARICAARPRRHAGRRSPRSRISAATRWCAPSSQGEEIARSSRRTTSIPAEPKVQLRPGRHQPLRRFLARRDGGLDHGKDLEQQGLVHGAAGAGAGRLLGRHPADDRGQLFGAGHVRQQRVLLGRHRLVRGDPALRPLLGGDGPQPRLLRHHPGDRDPARHLHRAQHAEERAGACRSAWC